ncbi:inositol monophosphatase family protein [Tomitella gaofuii]|uniref:inositol monophosphatase family protein n=1 Tax=Tomitella gaofuii TaxID=2760083 RepID=UPI0015FE747D|nr:inositol monophosphatase family protein [Tomitella gaofuii]
MTVNESPRVPSGLPDDPRHLLAMASGLLDGVVEHFRSNVGAPGKIDKGGRDFATQVDLELERRLGGSLLERTGIPVHGEEFGGPRLDTGTVWVLDPVDGTYNYSVGLPMAGVLLSLIHDGVPVLGLTWLPLVGQRIAATVDGPVVCNGVPLPPLEPRGLADSVIALGALNIEGRGRYPGRYRIAALGELSRRVSRMRMHGSTGADLAFTAAGVLDAAVGFGDHPWDNAAGVALVRAAGGVVTDLAGCEWDIRSPSVVVGAPGAQQEMLQVFLDLGDPEDFLPEPGEVFP